MHKLTKDQKIDNLKETKQILVEKVERLESQIQNIDAKIAKMQEVKETNQSSKSNKKIASQFKDLDDVLNTSED